MRLIILAAALVLAALPSSAATFRCKGFAFIGADFTCETSEPAVKAASFCDVMNRQGGPIMWSRNDTSETKNRVDLVNAVGKRLCGWGKK